MHETIVLARCHFKDGRAMWPFRVFTNENPEIVARLHLRALLATYDRGG